MKKNVKSVSYLLYICTVLFWCHAMLSAREKRASIFTALDSSSATVQEESPEHQSIQKQDPPVEPASETLESVKNLKRKRRLIQTLEDDRAFATDTQSTEQDLIPTLPAAEEPLTKKIREEAPTEEANIEFYFEDADMLTLLTQIKELYDVSFITDDNLDPLSKDGRALKGLKISFKTHKPLTRKAAWNLFLTFLDLAGFALVPEPDPGIYRIVTADKAQKMAVPTYIGVDATKLPDNDQVIRYVYFLENADPTMIRDIVNNLKSSNASAVVLQETKALVITDKSYNIKSLMEVVRELDQVTMPQAMAVIKLQRADAIDVAKLYEEITKTGASEAQAGRVPTPRKPSQALYFSENVRIIPEPRTNSLIVFGSADGIKKVEDFVLKVVDIDLEKPYSPLHTYQLRYASATTVADIMNTITNYGKDTEAGKAGGVRGGDKYLKPLYFKSEPSTNTIVVKGEYEDFLKALEIIKRLDEPQPQVAIEALIITIDWTNTKQLGTQLRNKVPDGAFGRGVNFQTSGSNIGSASGTAPSSIVVRSGDDVPGDERLLGNLINLAVGAAAGNTVISLGADKFGVWGIFSVLQTLTSAQIISNPFLVATNKTAAFVSIGEVRRVVSGTIFAGENPQQAFDDMKATLDLKVTPQINSDGMVVLNIDVATTDFLTAPSDTAAPATSTRQVVTKVIMADREVIAIGGLIQNRFTDDIKKVPILGDIPILGWLFKNKNRIVEKNNLLVLISARIIAPDLVDIVDEHTQAKLVDYYDTHNSIDIVNNWRDPVDKSFFQPKKVDADDVVENFLAERSKRLEGTQVANSNIKDKRLLKKKYEQEHMRSHGKYVPNLQNNYPDQTDISSYTPTSMLKYLERQGVNPIKLSENNTGRIRRKRDARRSMQTGEPKGVMA